MKDKYLVIHLKYLTVLQTRMNWYDPLQEKKGGPLKVACGYFPFHKQSFPKKRFVLHSVIHGYNLFLSFGAKMIQSFSIAK